MSETSRRSILHALAAATAVGTAGLDAAATPATADPIFTKIKTHRRLERKFCETCRRTDEVVAKKEGRLVTEEDEAAWTAALKASNAAWDAILDTTPTTLAGVRAMLEYVVTIDWNEEQLGDAITAVLRSPAMGGANV